MGILYEMNCGKKSCPLKEIKTIALQEKACGLNRGAWNIRVGDSGAAYRLSKQAIAISADIQYTKGKAEGYRTLAFCNIRLSKHDEARPLLQHAEKLFASMEDVCGQSDVLEYIANLTATSVNSKVYRKAPKLLLKSGFTSGLFGHFSKHCW
jgi:hypothetical protein